MKYDIDIIISREWYWDVQNMYWIRDFYCRDILTLLIYWKYIEED